MSIPMAPRSLIKSCLKLPSSTSATTTTQEFLRLAGSASQRSFHTTPLPIPVLDFLLPSFPLSHRNVSSNHPRSQYPSPSIRKFTTTSRQQTKAIFNPRKDEDGREMNIDITPRASTRLAEIMSQDSNPHLALRIQVESGGCHGFQYFLSTTTLPSSLIPSPTTQPTPEKESPPSPPISSSAPPPSPASLNPLAETKKDEERGLEEDDTVFIAEDGSEAKVVMDGVSLELLKGSKIDYTMALIGSQFKVVESPLATSSCGCGTSFDIKV